MGTPNLVLCCGLFLFCDPAGRPFRCGKLAYDDRLAGECDVKGLIYIYIHFLLHIVHWLKYWHRCVTSWFMNDIGRAKCNPRGWVKRDFDYFNFCQGYPFIPMFQLLTGVTDIGIRVKGYFGAGPDNGSEPFDVTYWKTETPESPPLLGMRVLTIVDGGSCCKGTRGLAVGTRAPANSPLRMDWGFLTGAGELKLSAEGIVFP
ncbi:hypothetical protein Tco_0133796 [Tanacetum coccineum]